VTDFPRKSQENPKTFPISTVPISIAMALNTDVDRVLQLINAKDIETLKAEEFDQFQYQGFDPIRLLAALVKMKVSKSIDDKVFVDDVMKMVAIGLIKGSVNTHNLTKMTDDGQKSLKELMGKYDIKMGGAGTKGQMASETLTFPRIMAAFPHIAVKMTKVLGGKDYRGGPLHSYTLPAVMKVSVFPAVIPRKMDEKVKAFLLTASLAYSMDQSVQISRLDKPDLKSLASTQSNFINIGHNSPVPDNDTRRQTFNQLGLPDKYLMIESVVKNYQEKVDNTVLIPTENEYKAALAVV